MAAKKKYYKNTKKGNPRRGLHYTIDASGAHVYKDKKTGKVTRIGGKKAKKPAPYDPTAPLSGKSFDDEIENQSRLRYGGQERELEAQGRISDQAKANVGGYWEEYQRRLAEATAKQQAGYQQATQGIYNQTNQAAAQSEQARQGLQQQAQPSMEARGIQGPSQVEGLAQQAAAARQASGSAQGNLLASQGATQNTFMTGQQGIGAGIRALELGKEDARKRQVRKQQLDLQGEKGAFKVTQRGALRQSEREYDIAQKTFGVNTADKIADNSLAAAKAAADAADKKANRQIKTSAEKRQQAKDKREMDKDAYQRRYGLGPYKPAATPKGPKSKTRSYGGYGSTEVTRAKGATSAAKLRALANAYKTKQLPPKGTDPILLNAAKEYAKNNGRVSKKTAQKLFRTYGFRVPIKKTKGYLDRPVKTG